MKTKAFDAVKMMREIREELHYEFVKHPEKRAEALGKIRTKYTGKWKPQNPFHNR